MIFRAHPGLNVYLGAVIALAIGAGLGCINGLLVAKARIPAIIATLGTLSAYRGLAFILSGGNQIDANDIPDALGRWSTEGPARIGGVTIPWIIVLTVLVVAAGILFTRFTIAGRNLYAVGSNAEAARIHGVPVTGLTIAAYTACGALAGFAGILYASQFGIVNPGSAGKDMELNVIAATVIGGCDVRGGSGSVVGVVLGCLLLGVINVVLSVAKIDSDWQRLVYGAVILLALALDAFVGRRTSEAAA
jgi:rhamnose transport system permease protein